MSGHLPTGIVTFLFTDIEGSTRLVAEVGDAAWGSILEAERDIVEGAVVAEGGVPFGSEGDAHFAVFPSAAGPTMAAPSSVAQVAGRARDAHAIGAASEKAVSETGLHIASLWSTGDIPLVDLATADPDLRAAVAEGRSLTRDEALDRAIALADELARTSSGSARPA